MPEQVNYIRFERSSGAVKVNEQRGTASGDAIFCAGRSIFVHPDFLQQFYNNHAAQIEDGRITPDQRAVAAEPGDPNALDGSMSVAQLKPIIEASTDRESLEKLAASDTRSTIHRLCELRIAELDALEEPEA